MNNRDIILKEIFLRLPRFPINLYLELASTPSHAFLEKLKSPAYSSFIDILKNEADFLAQAIANNHLTSTEKTTILNYLMRATSRFSPYKNFSGITKLELANITNFTENNFIEVKENTTEANKYNEYHIITNPNVKIVNDTVFFHINSIIDRIHNKTITNILHMNKIKKTSHNHLSVSQKQLLAKNLLIKRNHQNIYHEEGSAYSRTNLEFRIAKNLISNNELYELSRTLLHLSGAFSANECNKSIFWIQKIRERLFKEFGPKPISLKNLIIGDKLFRADPTILIEQAQSQITPLRNYLAELIQITKASNKEVLTLTQDNIQKIKSLAMKTPENLSRDFSVMGSFTEENKIVINYCRSSFLGIRPLAEYIKTVAKSDTHAYESSECIFCDILYQVPQKEVLLKRPKTTKHYISIDGSRGEQDQIEIDYEDLHIYASPSELVLFSQKLKKRIIPVITTSYLAENDTNPFYRILAAIAKSYFNDGIHLDVQWLHHDWLPRIEYKNVILFPKTWNIPKDSLPNLFKKLPKIIRMIDGDKDALLIRDSEYFLEQARKTKSSILQFQEDFHTQAAINTNEPAKEYLYQFCYRFATTTVLPKLPLKIYEENQLESSHISELRLSAPQEYLEHIMLHIERSYLADARFYFINYQNPYSHIRIRLLDDLELSEYLLEALPQDNYLKSLNLMNVTRTNYNAEESVYTGREGVQIYLEASIQMTKYFKRVKQLTLAHSIGAISSSGPVLEIIYLTFLSHYLVIKKSEQEFTQAHSYTQQKNVWKFIKEQYKNTNSVVYKLETLAKELVKELEPTLKKWTQLQKQNAGFEKPAYFFEHRLVHMEIFRMTSGEFADTNIMILRLAKQYERQRKYNVK